MRTRSLQVTALIAAQRSGTTNRTPVRRWVSPAFTVARVQNRPSYAITSVDHALQLAALLQHEGPLRVTDAARRLGIARSTAHRLLAMLVYRDFAQQLENRTYAAGPLLRRPAAPEHVSAVRNAALPHLRALTAETGETSHLFVVLGDQVRIVASAECTQVLRVGDREGRALPVHLASGGLAVLATRTEAQVRATIDAADPPVGDVDALLRRLRRVRRVGYAVNDQGTEAGVTAVGCAVASAGGPTSRAISLAIPTVRYRRMRLTEWARPVVAAAAAISRSLDGPPA